MWHPSAPSHGALCHAESRQHGLCRAETGLVGQFPGVQLRGGGETAETPRFAVCDQWFQRLQRSSHFWGGFFRVDLWWFDDLCCDLQILQCRPSTCSFTWFGPQVATIWRKMMPTLQTTFRHIVAMFVFFDIFSKTEFNSYVVCTAIWYWWWLLLWILIIWLIHWKKTTLTKGDFQSRRDWIYPWLLFPEAGICTIQQKTCTTHCYESSICLRLRPLFFNFTLALFFLPQKTIQKSKWVFPK